ncbi:MAG: hypothetical protein HF962_06980 [Sulfurovum sp.]|nr:hypothetical protein [Sulfurovum sp.]
MAIIHITVGITIIRDTVTIEENAIQQSMVHMDIIQVENTIIDTEIEDKINLK